MGSILMVQLEYGPQDFEFRPASSPPAVQIPQAEN
jgi:hypothetical protein